MLGPLWLYSLRRASRRQMAGSFALLAATVLGWLVPMLLQAGGVGNYAASLHQMWTLVPAREAMLPVGRVVAVGLGALLCLGSAVLLPFFGRGTQRLSKEQRVFVWMWIGPGLAFFTLVFFQFVNSGYLLVLAPPVFALLGWQAAAAACSWRGAALAAANVALYLYAPAYCSYGAVRRLETELVEIERGVRQLGRPEHLVVLAYPSHFLGYRHAAYYLPEYLTVHFPEAAWRGAMVALAMKDRTTRRPESLPLDPQRTFVVFPLLREEGCRRFLAQLEGRLPAGALRRVKAGNREFTVGSGTWLPLLLPSLGAHAPGQRPKGPQQDENQQEMTLAEEQVRPRQQDQEPGGRSAGQRDGRGGHR